MPARHSVANCRISAAIEVLVRPMKEGLLGARKNEPSRTHTHTEHCHRSGTRLVLHVLPPNSLRQRVEETGSSIMIAITALAILHSLNILFVTLRKLGHSNVPLVPPEIVLTLMSSELFSASKPATSQSATVACLFVCQLIYPH